MQNERDSFENSALSEDWKDRLRQNKDKPGSMNYNEFMEILEKENYLFEIRTTLPENRELNYLLNNNVDAYLMNLQIAFRC